MIIALWTLTQFWVATPPIPFPTQFNSISNLNLFKCHSGCISTQTHLRHICRLVGPMCRFIVEQQWTLMPDLNLLWGTAWWFSLKFKLCFVWIYRLHVVILWTTTLCWFYLRFFLFLQHVCLLLCWQCACLINTTALIKHSNSEYWQDSTHSPSQLNV